MQFEKRTASFVQLSCYLMFRARRPFLMRGEAKRFAFSDFRHQFGQQFQAHSGNMAELVLVEVVYWLLQFLEQLETFRGDTGLDDPAVILLPLPSNPAVFLHAIEKAGHVGVA